MRTFTKRSYVSLGTTTRPSPFAHPYVQPKPGVSSLASLTPSSAPEEPSTQPKRDPTPPTQRNLLSVPARNPRQLLIFDVDRLIAPISDSAKSTAVIVCTIAHRPPRNIADTEEGVFGSLMLAIRGYHAPTQEAYNCQNTSDQLSFNGLVADRECIHCGGRTRYSLLRTRHGSFMVREFF